ncbi:MAG: exodeoxyribonuclease VII large subunit [Anaerolineales bacterium]|jgi:exodeoxyribonuclease VII large subunit|nr:exodeoxyribonuclease VII large subunit [Anaerolineales bacterium]
MNQPSLFQVRRWSVTELTRHLRRIIESDASLQDTWVQGEISNLSRPSSGHIYFTLKDSGAALKCVIWKGDALRLRGLPMQDGLSIEAHGKIGVYEPGGQYQLYVDLVRPAGEGALYAEYLRLKALLEAEGLFASERKREIPQFPRKIGILTSATGAALRDMLQTLSRRMPLAEVSLAPAAVQGAAAPLELVAGLQKLNSLVQPDVILVARGGGSIEDLWAFNDERVVRAVAGSAAPVISGVGHETDFTLTDFAADLRAPTPTAAAELATPISISDLAGYVRNAGGQLGDAIRAILAEKERALDEVNGRMRYVSPTRRLATERQRVDDAERRMVRALEAHLKLEKAQVRSLAQRLESLNPLAILRRGYAVVTLAGSGKVVLTASQAEVGRDLGVRLAEGEIKARVTESG